MIVMKGLAKRLIINVDKRYLFKNWSHTVFSISIYSIKPSGLSLSLACLAKDGGLKRDLADSYLAHVSVKGPTNSGRATLVLPINQAPALHAIRLVV